MRISTLKLTVSISFFASALVIFIVCCLESLVGALLVGAAWFLFYMIMTAVYAKCPNCGKPLGKNFLQIDNCPHCDSLLD